MNFSKRFKTIFKELEKCDSFADVGCDHGYCTQYMLENSLCKRAYITDISEKSLKKAENLLSSYIQSGVLSSFCCDGLDKIPSDTSLVLIAGMGGTEIINIMERSFVPRKFVFQPMKNSRELRRYLVSKHVKIISDYTFYDGKFYDVIKGEKGDCCKEYSKAEYEFGRDNLLNGGEDFLFFLDEQIRKNKGYLNSDMSEENKRLIREKIIYLDGIKNETLRITKNT